MDNSGTMKWFKSALLYSFLFIYLYTLYQTTLPSLLLHYKSIDFRYFIFITIQIYWCTYFYEIVYQYIILYTFIRIRVSYFKSLYIFIKQLFKYISFYLILHFILFFVFFRQIPFQLLSINLIIQCFGFIFVLFFKKAWNYSYIFIIFIILCCHFIV